MQIITNNQPRPVLFAYELTEKERKEFDYIEDIASPDCQAVFVRYKGQVYDLGEFLRIVPAGTTGGSFAHYDHAGNLKGWQGIHTESFFSGVLIKYTDNDCEHVIVGRYFS